MESNQLNSPKVFSHKGQGKDTKFQAQIKRVFATFYRQPKTMLMVSVETGILRQHHHHVKRNHRHAYVSSGNAPIRVLVHGSLGMLRQAVAQLLV